MKANTNTRVPSDANEPFYVGYFPLPKPLKSSTVLMSMILILWMGGMCGMIALFMSDPGDGVWESGVQQSWDGTLTLTPYPMLVGIGADGSERVDMVVGAGKYGVHDRLAPLEGHRVRLKGWALRRDGRSMIELEPADSGIEDLGIASSRPLLTPSDPIGFESIGEIVDGKCYVGAMRPGDGMGHRSCAVLCVQGGLPPMFAYGPEDAPRFALLLVNGSVNLPSEILGVMAQRVRIKGHTWSTSGLQIIDVDAQDIELQ